jgi:predicted transcriptional regulator
MDRKKRGCLKANGWKTGSAKDFLKLSKEEETVINLRIALGTSLRRQRTRKRISQTQLAKQLGSSQSRVAKMEAGAASVSLDLQIRALVSLGATRKDVARAMASDATAS